MLGYSDRRQGAPLSWAPRCPRCGAAALVCVQEIAPGTISHAIACADRCGADTHWQMSLTEALRIWKRGPENGERGGNGDPADDKWGNA